MLKPTRFSLNRGWYFIEEEQPNADVNDYSGAWISFKAQRNLPTVKNDFEETGWSVVNLPHDYVLAHLPKQGLSGCWGCRERGKAWYRRHFSVPERERGLNFELQFDGISGLADIYINGAHLKHLECGYTGFSCDITPYIQYGDYLNTIAVFVNGEISEGWWYEGAGIYRDVWLWKRNAVHFVTDGIYANPVKAGKIWEIPFEAEIGNSGKADRDVYATFTLADADGKILAEQRGEIFRAELFGTSKTAFTVPVKKKVKLWDIENPNLYTVTAKLFSAEGELLDETEVKCGFRTILFTADRGFFLNGRHVKIQGTCNHQDHAGCGVAVPKSIEEFRIRRLKEMGCNAYRCSHNPPSRTILDYCDELGMLVMDENRHFSAAPEHLQQLQWLIRRDRNHPSVILWSIFNEEPLQCNEIGYELARKMCALIKKLDSTRYTTAAMNGGLFTPKNASQALDVMGINYYIFEYDHFHRIAPNQPTLSSEDTSAVTSRGAVKTIMDNPANTLADNDTEAVPWGATQRKAWEAIGTREWMAGGFAWTGFDYRGEPTPFSFPANVSFFGIVDHCGFAKTSFYIRQALWRKDYPVLYVAPHWNLKKTTGKIKVLVVSNAAEVELFLNGASLGRQTADPYWMNEYEVAYEPGVLKAVSYDAAGKVVKTCENRTTGKPVAVKMKPYRTEIAGDGYDMVPVAVWVEDQDGNRVPDADNQIVFAVKGSGFIAGVGNGNENSCEDDTASKRKLYNGYAAAFLRADIGGSGKLELTATARGLAPATVRISVRKNAADRLYEPVPEHRIMLNVWRRSQFSDTLPDPFVVLAKNDVNSWEQIPAEKPMDFPDGRRFVLLRTVLPVRNGKNRLVTFRGLVGRVECFYDGKCIGVKDSCTREEWSVSLPGKSQETTLTLRIEAHPKWKQGGFTGPVLY